MPMESKKEESMRKVTYIGLVAAFLLAFAGAAMAASPNFGPAIYADGQVWGTKGLASLPAPNGHNGQAFDMLFIFVNSNSIIDQLPVSEAGPGNPAYNGGRWSTYVVEWTAEGFAAYGTVPVLMSYDEILDNYDLGYLTITHGTAMGGPPAYFECPLLPVR
jgi:hypothetical protein